MEVATSGGEEKTASEMSHWWWAAGSAVQLGWGTWIYRRARAGECRNMPVKAFGVASLFVGAGAAALMGGLRACGIHEVEDLKVVGENIRTSLGAPPRKNTRET